MKGVRDGEDGGFRVGVGRDTPAVVACSLLGRVVSVSAHCWPGEQGAPAPSFAQSLTCLGALPCVASARWPGDTRSGGPGASVPQSLTCLVFAHSR